MAMAFQVHGEARIQTKTGAAGTAFEDLCVTVRGVTFEPQVFRDPIFTDTYGPSCPFDHQYFLEAVRIRGTFIWFDQAVLNKIIAANIGLAPGTLMAAGTVLGLLPAATAGYHGLKVLSGAALIGGVRTFVSTFLEGPQPHTVGTVRTTGDLTWFCFPYTGVAGPVSGTNYTLT